MRQHRCRRPAVDVNVDRLTLDEIRAELDWLALVRLKQSVLGPHDEARYQRLADRERALLHACP